MFDFLRDHAYKNVWCTPEQDNQIILEPAKLTPFGGVTGNFKVIWRNLVLPDQTSTWHVFQIGQVHPLILGLFPKCNQWTSFKETCNRQKMICDIYNISGVQLPRSECFYIHNQDRNLIVAIKRNDKIPFNFNNDKIFLRLYSNQYFNSLRANSVDDFIHVEGGVFTTTNEILAFQALYDSYKLRDGQTYAFVNGIKVDNIDLITLNLHDSAEFVYDSSIYKVVDFSYSSLREFSSHLDLKKKFLLHYSGGDNQTIDYQDDIDVFVIHSDGFGRHRGLFYHKNNEDAMRMVTHRDYSLVVAYFDYYREHLNKITSPNQIMDIRNVFFRLHIRKSGWRRDIGFEHNRIHELYKMQDGDIQNAFLGIDSTVNNWRAEVLENSNYTRIMRSNPKDVTNAIVQYAYGYNAISKIIADTPSETYVFSGVRVADVPYMLQQGCTAYEYDVNGHLLGWYQFAGGVRYNCVNQTCRQVELVAGIGGNILDEVYGFSSVPINSSLSYRVYECSRVSGLVDNKFKDVTSTSKYRIENNLLIWTEPSISSYPMIRSDARFLAFDTTAMMNDGELKITLNHLQRRGNTTSNWVMHVPMGEIDIFMNKRPLIRGLDYVVNFPEIIVFNKEYLVNPITAVQEFHIRFTGFCDKDFQLTKENDVGFIEHGYLSNNNKFDLRDDKVLRIVVDGALKTKTDFTFSELHSGVSTLNPLNGKPYCIRDMVIPMRGLTEEDTYSLRRKSLSVDQAVSTYLSRKIPQPDRPNVSAIPNRYQIFSPFVCKILYDLADDRLVIQDRIYTVQEVILLCKRYEYLLKFDPTQIANKVDDRYVIIHPHGLLTVIQISMNKYRFLETVVRKYTNNLVSLSPFVQIAS